MKILKLLNKKIFSIKLICFIFFAPVFAEEKPIDIWNIEKKDNQVISETNTSSSNTMSKDQNSVYELQTNKQILCAFALHPWSQVRVMSCHTDIS